MRNGSIVSGESRGSRGTGVHLDFIERRSSGFCTLTSEICPCSPCVALSSLTVFDALLEEHVEWVEQITDEDVGATQGGEEVFRISVAFLQFVWHCHP